MTGLVLDGLLDCLKWRGKRETLGTVYRQLFFVGVDDEVEAWRVCDLPQEFLRLVEPCHVVS